MISWVTAQGEDPNSLQGQLDFLVYELKTSYNSVYSTLKSATSSDIDSAVTTYVVDYEAPSNEPVEISQGEAEAPQLLQEYGGDVVSGSGGSGCSSSGSGTTTSSGTCQNPFRDISNLRVERIDQGVDYAGSGNVYAVCPGTITITSGLGGWNYGGPPWTDAYIVIKISGGPYNGLLSYMAEECTPQVQIGQQVTTSTVICTMDNPNSTGIETGWAASPTDSQPLAQLYGGNGCCSTTAGVSYDNLLMSVGTPSGILDNSPPLGDPLPSPYPSSIPAPNIPTHFSN